MANKRVSVVQQTPTGRNETFKDNSKGSLMSRAEFVQRIQAGQYPKYHVRSVNGVRTPVSNPDRKKGNNLG